MWSLVVKYIDVTDSVEFEWNDDECLPITKCVCGAKFAAWEHIISIYEEDPYKCPKCGVGLYFRPMIRVYKLVEGMVVK